MLPVMALLLIVVQETAARCGCVTGKGFASLIREKFGARTTALAMVALLIANTAVTISEFAGIASGLALFGSPKTVSVALMGLLIWLLTMSGSFRRIEKILLLVSCDFVTYVVAAFLAGPNWGEVSLSTVKTHMIPEPSYVSLLDATIGTTIAPGMLCLAQNNGVDKNADESDIVLQRIDTTTGSVIACAIAWFIIITTGAVLYLLAGPNWGEVSLSTVKTHMIPEPSYVSLLDATIGTTIAPGMLCLAQNNGVDKNADESDIVLQRIDTTTGSVIACAIAWFIIITTGAVLYPAGIEVADAADAALALEPIAGEFATVLFARGRRRRRCRSRAGAHRR